MDKRATKAVIKSIAHWEEDILAPLLEGDVIDENSWWLVWQHSQESVPCYDGDCPLCHYYHTKTCDKCPYKIKYSKKCDDDGEPWMAWIKDPTIENAIMMIRKLKGILKEATNGRYIS